MSVFSSAQLIKYLDKQVNAERVVTTCLVGYMRETVPYAGLYTVVFKH